MLTRALALKRARCAAGTAGCVRARVPVYSWVTKVVLLWRVLQATVDRKKLKLPSGKLPAGHRHIHHVLNVADSVQTHLDVLMQRGPEKNP